MRAPPGGESTSYTSSHSHTNRGRSGPASAAQRRPQVVAPRRRVPRAAARPAGGDRGIEVPGQLRHQTASGRVGPHELVLLRDRQGASQIFDRTAQFN